MLVVSCYFVTLALVVFRCKSGGLPSVTQALQMFGWFCFGSTSMFIMLIMLIVLLVVLLAQCQSGGLLADTADVWNWPVAAFLLLLSQ